MKTIITYGTFDMLHHGHINLLTRAKELGDRLIVGVTSELYDRERGKLNVSESLSERIDNIKKTGLADKIIVEEYEGQKINDILLHQVDCFVIGSDWIGKFDYLREYCEVVYLDRTRGISSTELRAKNMPLIRLGMIGCGRIASRFVPESKYVSGVHIQSVYNPNLSSAAAFCQKFEIEQATDEFDTFASGIDAVYIASPHPSHYQYIQDSLMRGKHVLCEKPMVLSAKEAEYLYQLAESKKLVLMEAIKTAYAPAFHHLITLVKSGIIGNIKDIDATFTKLVSGNPRELDAEMGGGSVNELASYPLLAIVKILGTQYRGCQFYSYMENNVDIYTRGIIHYESAIATMKVGLGVKSEGELIISGTKGYVYVPAPWWKTSYFEVRFEDLSKTQKYFYKFADEGIRYELVEFAAAITGKEIKNRRLNPSESISIIDMIEKHKEKAYTQRIG